MLDKIADAGARRQAVRGDHRRGPLLAGRGRGGPVQAGWDPDRVNPRDPAVRGMYVPFHVRQHALDLYQAIRKHVDLCGYTDCGTLVAFSGPLKDSRTDLEFTEAGSTGSRKGRAAPGPVRVREAR